LLRVYALPFGLVLASGGAAVLLFPAAPGDGGAATPAGGLVFLAGVAVAVWLAFRAHNRTMGE
jgi:uncharacterized membrane protein YgdD (TMEM256/DUF423 family)